MGLMNLLNRTRKARVMDAQERLNILLDKAAANDGALDEHEVAELAELASSMGLKDALLDLEVAHRQELRRLSAALVGRDEAERIKDEASNAATRHRTEIEQYVARHQPRQDQLDAAVAEARKSTDKFSALARQKDALVQAGGPLHRELVRRTPPQMPTADEALNNAIIADRNTTAAEAERIKRRKELQSCIPIRSDEAAMADAMNDAPPSAARRRHEEMVRQMNKPG
jgi:hypothetical protein